jgi:hypothetical protein
MQWSTESLCSFIEFISSLIIGHACGYGVFKRLTADTATPEPRGDCRLYV